MNLLIATDSFKDSLSSLEAGTVMAQAARTIFPRALITVLPLSDGGEGMSTVFAQITGAQMTEAAASDPLGRPITAQYALSKNGTAYIELAAASGLTLLKTEERNPLNTSTFGTGQLIMDALQRKAKRIVIGLGGSATNDAGTGLLSALGLKFLNKKGEIIEPCGKNLHEIDAIDVSTVTPLIKNVEFIACCDVNSPLFGPKGAACVFARQKGATAKDIELLDNGLKHFAEIVLPGNLTCNEGDGAAGGTGFALSAFLHAKLVSGIQFMLSTPVFTKTLEEADLILTGEGQMDSQSTMGKATWGLLAEARRLGKPICAVAGRVTNRQTAIRAGFLDAVSSTPRIMPLQEATKPAVARQNILNATTFMLKQLYRKP